MHYSDIALDELPVRRESIDIQGMEGAVKEISLLGQHIFDHSVVLRPTIERFVAAFEKNERHKEFEGILRASHSLVEAAETATEQMLAEGRLREMTERVEKITQRIEALTTPKYHKEHEEYLTNIKAEQDKYLSLCEAEAMRKMRLAAGVQQ